MGSDIPIDLLEDIFLYLDDAADLVRLSAACTSFRRVVSDGRFLRRFRSVHHRRPILGLLLEERHQHCRTASFCAAQPPRRSALAAAGFAKAADFTFSFLPDRGDWRVCDARDGRVLLARGPHGSRYVLKVEDLVVYDPLHRRHVQIPTIPGDLLLSAKQDGDNKALKLFDNPFLISRDADEGFRVMWTGLSKTKVVALVFSSASGQWRHTSLHDPSYEDWTLLICCWSRQCVHGCVCWTCRSEDVMLVFDTCEMKFSIADLPHESIDMLKMVVEAGDGRLGGLLILNDYDGCTTTMVDLYSKQAWQQGVQQEPEEWRHDSSVPIMPGFHWMLAGAAEGYALLRGIPLDQYKQWIHKPRKKQCFDKPEAHYFTLELKTFLVEKLCVLELEYDDAQISFLYASFPPPFSPPRV